MDVGGNVLRDRMQVGGTSWEYCERSRKSVIPVGAVGVRMGILSLMDASTECIGGI